MTRYTNLGRKRTYVEAGFQGSTNDELSGNDLREPPTADNAAQPPAKKKKNPGKSERKAERERIAELGGGANWDTGKGGKFGGKGGQRSQEKRNDKNRPKDADARKFASERRRVKRQDDRWADTTCFACRGTGHAAKDCRNAPTSNLEIEQGDAAKPRASRTMVGICYRCGSRKHNLSGCSVPVKDPENPLPFASCFVCSGKGHLSSNCPKNSSRGIYPNGGCCKLCGETTHLAKDCQLRKPNIATNTLLVGTEAGADEDDFHVFKRKTAEINLEEKDEEKKKKLQDVKVGVHSGVVKSFGKQEVSSRSKKVVSF